VNKAEEDKAEADSVRHAKEFCRKRNIPEEEWKLAVDSRDAIVALAWSTFWGSFKK
jgi:hypothetical protein